MLARVKSSSLQGAGALSVDVEVKVQRSETVHFSIIGLADNAVKESRERVIAALRSSGFFVPERVLVNLAPAEMKKEGAAFDLAIAFGILIASGQIRCRELSGMHFVGELSLDGSLKPLNSAIAHGVSALHSGAHDLVMPAFPDNSARLVSELNVVEISSLLEGVEYIVNGVAPEQRYSIAETRPEPTRGDIAEVRGQHEAKRALVIAAAGGHNVLFVGPPGCGKSMLAERFSSLLPPLSRDETLEVARLHSVVGTPLADIMQGKRPFRAPHHVISEPGLVGGGMTPRPGEVSLAHRGVLFLDEFPEFKRSAIEAMRSPLESGSVTVSRAKATVSYPANFQLIAAMNPCPCGRLGAVGMNCTCSRNAISSYLRKLSQPILDRIDLQVHLDAVSAHDLVTPESGCNADGPTSAELKEQVILARERGEERSGSTNALLSNKEVVEACALSDESNKLLGRVSQQGLISARKYYRMLKVSRTIADLDGTDDVRTEHIAEAMSYRCLEKIEQFAMGTGR
jgi:magnesium chelatase family protein